MPFPILVGELCVCVGWGGGKLFKCFILLITRSLDDSVITVLNKKTKKKRFYNKKR